MGMYTELCLNVMVQNDPEVVRVFEALRKSELPDNVPDHPFFKLPRARFILTSSSYYFVPSAHCTFEYNGIADAYVLMCRSDLKNYDLEIENFINWLDPYIVGSTGDFIGYSRYEEEQRPTLHFKDLSPLTCSGV